MRRPCHKGLAGWGCVVMASAWLGMGGCVSQQRDRIIVEETRRGGAESGLAQTLPATTQREEASSTRRALERGLRDFRRGRYGKALRVFEALRRGGGDESLRREALYALACTRLLLAKDPEAFKQAVALWQRWRDSAVEATGEDPGMMTPLLERMAGLLQGAEVQRRRQLEASAVEIERLQGLLAQREEEIKRLRHQLEALETIHRSIKEKHREVTTD